MMDGNFVTFALSFGFSFLFFTNFVDMETTSEYSFNKGAMCQIVVGHKYKNFEIQHTLVDPSPYIQLVISHCEFRIEHWMNVNRFDDMEIYTKYLEQNRDEVLIFSIIHALTAS